MIGYGYDRFLRALYSRPQENAVELSGIPPLHLTGSKGKPLKNYRIYGNTQRAITIDGVKYPVPDDVTLVDYITGDGYFDLAIKGTQNTKVEETVTVTTFTTSVAAHTFGDFITNTQAITMNLKQSGNSRFGDTYLDSVFGTLTTDKHTYGVDKNGFSVDGVVTTALTGITDFTTTGNLFWMSANFTSVVDSAEAKYYGLKVWEDSVLVCLYHPAKKNNVVGVYDFVSKQFIAPTSGTLTAGKTTRTVNYHTDIPSDLYTELAYLGLADNAYFNTGIHANPSKTNSRMKVRMTNLSGTTGLFGTRNRTSSSNQSYNIFGAVSGDNGRFDNVNPSSSYVFTANTWYDIELGHNGLKGTVTINGTLLFTDGNNMENIDAGEILIGILNNNGIPFNGGTPAQWEYVEIAADGENIDFRGYPVRRNSDNVVGFYNAEDGTFITTASGTATAGDVRQMEVPLCEYESVGERTENLFDDANVEWIDGKYINDRGTIISDAGSYYTDSYIPIEPDTTYTLSGFSDEVGSGSLRVHFYDSDKEWLKLGGKTNLSNEKITFTTTNATKYIRFSGKAFVDVMLVKGSVVPSSYIPYGYRVPIRIETGNLINLTAVTDGYYYNDSGVYTQTTDARLTDWIKADAGDVLTLTCTRTGTPRLRMCFFDADKNYISQENTNASETLTATAPANTAYVRMSANYQGSLCIDWNTATLIKAAPTVTVYLSAPLEKVTDADYIDFTRQIWHREIGVKVFDGTEDWAYDSAYMRFYVSLSDIVTVSPPRTVPGICSHYKLISDSRSISDVTVGQCYFGPMGQKGNCLIIHNGTSDLTYFKAWLAAQYANGTPVTVWYPLATPVEESITLPSISAIAGGCYADVQTAIKPSNLQIKYLK